MCRTTPSVSALTSIGSGLTNRSRCFIRSRGTSRTSRLFSVRFSTTTTPLFIEGSLPGGTAVYHGGSISQAIRQQASATLDHDYTGFYLQDKWRASTNLTLNAGVRWEFETWPSGVLNTQWKNVDPRVGLAYSLGT